MRAPIDGPLLIMQLFGSLKGGPGEAYDVWHDGRQYRCVGHAGLDINAAVGTPVRAMKGGLLSITPHDPWVGGYATALGLYAVITLPSGETHTYAHLSSVSGTQGEQLPEGRVFAYTGNSGASTGPHLHTSVRPPMPDWANGFDATVDHLTHFDHDVYPLIDLRLV